VRNPELKLAGMFVCVLRAHVDLHGNLKSLSEVAKPRAQVRKQANHPS
jgi:hypothetical protein